MEHATPYYAMGLINQVNVLIDEVEYLLDTATDATYLNERLIKLAQWAGEISGYIQANNELDLLGIIKPSAPLYRLMLKAKMPGDTRVNISHYCKMIDELRVWGRQCKKMPSANQDISFRDMLQQLDEEGKDRFIGIFADFLKSGITGRQLAMIIKGLVKKAYLPNNSAKKLHTAFVLEFGDNIVKWANFNKYYSNTNGVTPPKPQDTEAVKSIVEKLTGQTYL